MTDHQQYIQDLRLARRRWQEDPSEENTTEVARLYKLAHPSSNRQVRLRKKRYHDNRTTEGENWLKLLKQYGNQCVCCGADGGERGELLVPDHIVPLIEGGKDSITNIQPLCTECNSKKWTKTLDFRKTFPTNELGNVTKTGTFVT